MVAVATSSNLNLLIKSVLPAASKSPVETFQSDLLFGHGFQGLIEATSLGVNATAAAAFARCCCWHGVKARGISRSGQGSAKIEMLGRMLKGRMTDWMEYEANEMHRKESD